MSNQFMYKNGSTQYVTIRLELCHRDGVLCFERPAPQLPSFMTWHKGLWIEVGNDQWMVEAVYVFTDGSVRIIIEETYVSNLCETPVEEFTACGWVLDTDEAK